MSLDLSPFKPVAGQFPDPTPIGSAFDAIQNAVNAITPPTVAKKNSQTVLASSAALTDITAGALTFASGLVTATSIVEIVLFGVYTNNTGSNANLSFNLRLNATDIAASTLSVPASAQVRGWDYRATIVNQGATNNQNVGEIFKLSAPGSGGLPVWTETFDGAASRAAAADLSGANTFKLMIQHGANSANLDFRCAGGLARII